MGGTCILYNPQHIYTFTRTYTIPNIDDLSKNGKHHFVSRGAHALCARTQKEIMSSTDFRSHFANDVDVIGVEAKIIVTSIECGVRQDGVN